MSLSPGRGDRVHSQAATHRSLSPLAGLGIKGGGASEPRVETRGYYLPLLPGLEPRRRKRIRFSARRSAHRILMRFGGIWPQAARSGQNARKSAAKFERFPALVPRAQPPTGFLGNSSGSVGRSRHGSRKTSSRQGFRSTANPRVPSVKTAASRQLQPGSPR
jgi:hypothetical protein